MYGFQRLQDTSSYLAERQGTPGCSQSESQDDLTALIIPSSRFEYPNQNVEFF